jgi:hypothetical protein
MYVFPSGNQNPYLEEEEEEEQTTQWQKVKRQRDQRRFTKHTYKTKDLVTRTPLKTKLGYFSTLYMANDAS